jgi:hypothetical protein
VRLIVSPGEQERRLGEASRRDFGKMDSVELLRRLRHEFDECEARMPSPSLTINTAQTMPDEAALAIARKLDLALTPKAGARMEK